jgi:hypothetical protein
VSTETEFIQCNSFSPPRFIRSFTTLTYNLIYDFHSSVTRHGGSSTMVPYPHILPH